MFDVHNIDTFAKKFKIYPNFFFMAIKKRHPKTFLLQDKKDACQSPVSEETFHDWFYVLLINPLRFPSLGSTEAGHSKAAQDCSILCAERAC